MSRRPRAEARRAGWMILGLLAIPFASVSSVAMLADVASTTDPRAALIGVPAVLGGAVMGALVFRLAGVVRSGAVAVCAALLRAIDRGVRAVVVAVDMCAPTRVLRPALVFVPASIGRRGPPLSLR